jgi:hypothetical protein
VLSRHTRTRVTTLGLTSLPYHTSSSTLGKHKGSHSDIKGIYDSSEIKQRKNA